MNVMKKFLIILASLTIFVVSASAQRENVTYLTGGVIHRWSDSDNFYPGANLAFGFRNYNPEAGVSFSYGAELLGYWVPDAAKNNTFGAYAIPEIGIALGPRGFIIVPHAGFMAGYSSDRGTFGTGGKAGLAFDFGSHITLDFSSYYIKGSSWISALNFIWRF